MVVAVAVPLFDIIAAVVVAVATAAPLLNIGHRERPDRGPSDARSIHSINISREMGDQLARGWGCLFLSSDLAKSSV